MFYNGKTLGQINPPTVGGYIPQAQSFAAGRRKIVVGGITAVRPTVSGPYSINAGMETMRGYGCGPGCGFPYSY